MNDVHEELPAGWAWATLAELCEINPKHDKLVDRMAAALGEPAVDPHGAPIPTREGTVDETVYRALDALEAGEWARVARVSEHDAGVLRYLDELGLRPGAEVRLMARAPFGGPITVEVAGAVRAIGPALAGRIVVSAAGP